MRARNILIAVFFGVVFAVADAAFGWGETPPAEYACMKTCSDRQCDCHKRCAAAGEQGLPTHGSCKAQCNDVKSDCDSICLRGKDATSMARPRG